MAKYYDVAMRATETVANNPDANITLLMTMYVAETDFHAIISEEGVPGSLEQIRIAGQVYEREDILDPEWKPVPHKLNNPFWEFGTNPLCPDVSGFRELGTEDLSGVEVKRYTDKPNDYKPGLDVSDAFQGIKESQFHDLLIDTDGQVLKIEYDIERVVRNEYNDYSSRIRVEALISGIGDGQHH